MTGLMMALRVAGLTVVLAGAFLDIAGMLTNDRRHQYAGVVIQASGWVVVLAADLVLRNWAGAVIAAVCGGSSLWSLWRNRRNKRRRKALAALGEKSRAVRDGMVRRAREAARPRPVLRPAPGGAS